MTSEGSRQLSAIAYVVRREPALASKLDTKLAPISTGRLLPVVIMILGVSLFIWLV
jgi:hypothetical protein